MILTRFFVQPPVRGNDIFGSGHYLAPRGTRIHKGVDFEVCIGTRILAVKSGVVTKIGRPYANPDKAHYRYVQVTDGDGFDTRYFYINPVVTVGDKIADRQELGKVQSLQATYPGITDHCHFEVKKNGHFINPWFYLNETQRKQA